MRSGIFFAIVALFLVGLRARGATDPGVEFTGVVVADGVTRLALTEKSTALTQWVENGGEFKGCTVVGYEPKQETIVVRKDGADFRLPLVSAKSPVTLASSPPASVPVAVTMPAPATTPPVTTLEPAPAPVATVPAASVTTTPPPAAPENAPPSYYTVKAGDTLATVAANTGVTVEQLAALNPALSPNALKAGEAIRTK